MQSGNEDCGLPCGDIFERPDGSFGLREYRRDVEDGRRWFPIGFHAHRSFRKAGQAWRAALQSVEWLDSEYQAPDPV